MNHAEVATFLARRIGNVDEARLAHDAWLRMAERKRSGKAPAQPGREISPPDDPNAYLFTVARHLAWAN